jgi:hypothetical protein
MNFNDKMNLINEYNMSIVNYNNINILSDMDNVLVSIDIPAYNIIKKLAKQEKYKSLNKYFKLDYTDEEIIKRKTYDIFEFILKTDVYPSNLRNLFLDFTFKNKNFYTNLKPTQYCIAIKEYISTKAVSGFYVLTKCLDNTEDGKIEWIKKVFGEELYRKKIHFINCGDEKKSDVLNKRYPNLKWNSYAEDVLDNIHDVVTNCDGEFKEIIMPQYGYNEMDIKYFTFVDKYHLNFNVLPIGV